MPNRDIEKDYPKDQMIAKLERLVDCLKNDKAFEIQVAGERLYIPADTTFNIAHEVEDGEHELEFQFVWQD